MTSGVRKMAAVAPRWPERLPVKVNKVEIDGAGRGHSIGRPSRPAVSWSVWREGCRCDWRRGRRGTNDKSSRWEEGDPSEGEKGASLAQAVSA